MEPLTSTAIAIATLIFTKVFEKTGEHLGETVSTQAGKLLQLVRQKALPKTGAIAEPNQTVDYGQAVLELEAAEKTDPELAETIQALAAAEQDSPNLAQQVSQFAGQLQQTQPTTIQNYSKLAEKIGIVLQGGGSVSIENFNF